MRTYKIICENMQ